MAEPQVKPKELLEQLKTYLAQNKQKSVDVTKEIGVLESRVADLTKITGETEQKVTAYEKARSGLDDQRKKSDDVVKAKKKMLEDVLPNEQEISDKKKQKDNALKDIKDQLDQISNTIDQKQDALKAAQKTLDTKKSDYARELDLVGSLAKDLKELQDLEKLVDQENQQNNFARMYFYVLEMEAKLADAIVPTVEAYRNTVEGAAANVAQAIEDVRQKKDELDKAIADQKTKQTEYDDAKAKGRQKTAASIPDGVPPAEEPE
jgi:chromosome segregation ATPase